MGEGRREEIQRVYLRLEDEFLDLTEDLSLVPDLADPRYAVPCPRTAEFGLNCCTWVETLCRELLTDDRLSQYREVDEVRQMAVPKMRDCRGILRDRRGVPRTVATGELEPDLPAPPIGRGFKEQRYLSAGPLELRVVRNAPIREPIDFRELHETVFAQPILDRNELRQPHGLRPKQRLP